MKKYLYTTGVILLFLAIISYQGRRIKTLKGENVRLGENQRALLEDITFYKTRAGASAASVEKLTLTKQEFENKCADLTRLCNELNIKLKRLQSTSTTSIENKTEFTAPLRDTIIIRDAVPAYARKFLWRDTWTKVEGIIEDHTVNCKVHSRDTIDQIVYRVPRKFLFFRWGTKAIRQEIVTRNKNSKIIYTEYIELKRKNRFSGLQTDRK